MGTGSPSKYVVMDVREQVPHFLETGSPSLFFRRQDPAACLKPARPRRVASPRRHQVPTLTCNLTSVHL